MTGRIGPRESIMRQDKISRKENRLVIAVANEGSKEAVDNGTDK